jgi:uncharacterized membrane protein YeaQ/YmgE (transglycosylase-associated protein family)
MPNAPTLVPKVRSTLRLDLCPLAGRPGPARIALAGLIGIVGSLVADAILVALGKVTFKVHGGFDPFHFGSYAPLTVLGVVGATIGWAVLTRLTSEPRWVVRRAALVVTLVLLVPDVVILPGNPAGGVATLMVMHVAIAVITTAALLLVAPARGTVTAARPSGRTVRA